ncbi:hypothetical protein FXN61_05480 [Lentzea sp. PSKA42]|uniref:Uncharacterized protein n=1 Tax=Lentzea indica TaxID=2604800 RepID=A0ABX1FBL7_9PSEU|nr:hypothetical protein [Lentzea indica]NKE56305.1 hypothetical protein [Lentzea indica]
MKSSSPGPLSRLAAVQHAARDALSVVGLALFVILACVVTKTSAAVIYALAVLLGVAVLLIIVACCLVSPRLDERPRQNGKKLP